MAKTKIRMRSRGRGSNRLGAIEVLTPQLHRSWLVQVLLAVWRWSFEITLLVVLLLTWFHLRATMPGYAVAAVLVAPVAIACNFPRARRLLSGMVWVLIIRHRMRTALVQSGIRNRSGKLPWLVGYRPTPVGVRVTLLLVAGLSATDVENAADALAAACWARQVRVDKSRRLSALVRVDVIRRDPLESNKPIGSRLLHALNRTEPVTVDATPAADTNGLFRTGAYGVTATSPAADPPPTPTTNKKKPPAPGADGDDGGISEYV